VFFPNELIICLLYIYLHIYCIIMYLYIGVCLFMFFPLFTINHPPPLHRVNLGYGDLHQHKFLIYIFCFKCNHMFDGVHNAYCSSNIWGFKVKGSRCITWKNASLVSYLKTTPYLTQQVPLKCIICFFHIVYSNRFCFVNAKLNGPKKCHVFPTWFGS
jgi:hypothetical protein